MAHSPAILAVTGDEALRGRLERIAAAAGTSLHTATTAADPLVSSATLVLLGTDRLETAQDWRRRPGLVLVTPGPVPPTVWEEAFRLGAEDVAVLPESDVWLAERLLEAGDPALPEAPLLGVVGGRGGAGASAFACVLALTAAEWGMRTLLADADPLGGGLDLALDAQGLAGLRWSGLASARGRLRPDALLELPCVDGVRLLAWDAAARLTAEAMSAALRGLSRACDAVVVDLARPAAGAGDGSTGGSATEAALRECSLVVLVVPAEVRAAAAAARVLRCIPQARNDIRLVVRGPAPGGLRPDVVADGLGLPLAGWLRPEPGVGPLLDRGQLAAVRSRGPLRSLARQLLADVLPGGGR